ncbi:MAG: 6-carboxytetrahydropterin synthase [Gammaproteobacteria bacterium]|nr:6-carboxytetrahydropterin synthase [Gammaproteobacteria bacterium]
MSKVVIEVVRESLHFSAAHFTIFSATERENLHGHNFQLNGVFEGDVNDDGLCFDYGEVKDLLQVLCDELDERFLVPANSPHLQIETSDGRAHVSFNGETMSLPEHDVLVLPLRNITVEELAGWMADRLIADVTFQNLGVTKMELRVASGSGQWGVVLRDLS